LLAHKISKILLPIDGSEYSMRAVDYAIVEAKKEEDVELFAIHVVFIRQDYSLNFLAELGGGHVHTRIPEKIEKEIQGWFDIIKEKTDQNKLELRTDIVVGSKPVAWVVVDYAKVQNVANLKTIGCITLMYNNLSSMTCRYQTRGDLLQPS
jgi:nucleotide-binding universal stress UspA family protein